MSFGAWVGVTADAGRVRLASLTSIPGRINDGVLVPSTVGDPGSGEPCAPGIAACSIVSRM
jgi:hypothetical protein